MRNELLQIAAHCRVLSDHTIDLGAAAEFRSLAERLQKLAIEEDAMIASAAKLSSKVVE
jgi:hypothetical protein